jgi:hypothetical protein
MFRKTLLGLIAAAALITTAFAPTAASAGYGYGYGYRSYYKPYYNYYQPTCFYKKVYGYYGYELVKVCH